MPKHTAQWVALEQCVDFYISEARLTSADKIRLWHLAYRCLEDLGINVTEDPKTRKLPVLSNKIVELPDDYIQWVKVGVLNENGEVATLRYNKDLSMYAATDEARTSSNTDATYSTGLNCYRNYQYGDCYYNLFGVPGGTYAAGEFKVNDTEGIVILDNNFPADYVILEYVSSPAADKDYLIPIQVQETVIAWLRWVDIRSIPSGRRSNLGMIAERRHEYFEARRKAKLALNPLRTSHANDIIRLANRISIRS